MTHDELLTIVKQSRADTLVAQRMREACGLRPRRHRWQGKAIYIERIDREYWPRIYRCRSTANGGWSMTEEEIELDYKLLWRKKTDEN